MPEYPESGDYVVGRFEVSARVTDGIDSEGFHGPHSPVVIVSSAKSPRTFLTATPADARGMASALRVAADQADTDAGTEFTADSTPEWIMALDAERRDMAALRAELDAVTAERDNALAELANCPDEGYADYVKAKKGEADTHAMRKAMGWVVDSADEADAAIALRKAAERD